MIYIYYKVEDNNFQVKVEVLEIVLLIILNNHQHLKVVIYYNQDKMLI